MITIDTLYMDFQAGNMAFAQKLYAEWEHFCRYSIEKVIDDTISIHDKEGMVIEVQQLELEIGPIAEEEFYDKFPILFARELQEKFSALLLKHPDPYRQDIRIITQQENELEVLTFFLLYGYFPSSSPNRLYHPSALLQSILESDRQPIGEMLYHQWHHIPFRKRWVMQYSDPELSLTVHQLIPEESPFISQYALTLIQTQPRSEYHQIAQSAYRSVVWIFIFSYLLYEGYNLFSRKQFVWQTISELAAHFNLDREVLFRSLFFYLHSSPGEDKQMELLRIITEIGEEQHYLFAEASSTTSPPHGLSNASAFSDSIEQGGSFVISKNKRKGQEANTIYNLIEENNTDPKTSETIPTRDDSSVANNKQLTESGESEKRKPIPTHTKDNNKETSKPIQDQEIIEFAPLKGSMPIENKDRTAEPETNNPQIDTTILAKDDSVLTNTPQPVSSDTVSSETTNHTIQKDKSSEEIKGSKSYSEHLENGSSAFPRSSLFPGLHSSNNKGTYPHSLPFTGENGQNTEQRFFIENAGLVLLSPFLSTLFKRLGFIEKGAFTSMGNQIRAIFVLQQLLDPQQNEWAENALLLNKLLTGFPLTDEPLPISVDLTGEELDMCESLLNACKQQWSKMKNTSAAAFRESFLIRQGVLEAQDNSWILKVEQKTFDILLDTIPWTYSPVKYSWMEVPLYVQWR